MTGKSQAAAATLLLVLASCGSGGGDVKPAPIPTLAVVLTPASQTAIKSEGQATTPLVFAAAVAGTTTDPVIPDLTYDHAQLTMQGDVAKGPDGTYQVKLQPVDSLAPGSYEGTATFRLCRDTGCATVYPGSTQTFAYHIDARVKDWLTFQRNAAHDGYVPATFDSTKFKKAWEWSQTDRTMLVSSVASSNGLAFFSTRESDGTSAVRALSATTGEQRWLYSLGGIYTSSPPAIGNDKLFVTTMTMSSGENQNVALDAATGRFTGPSMLFASQWSSFLPPTPFEDGLYMSAGYYGSVVYGYNYGKGTKWDLAVQGAVWEGETPAVDSDTVYYYSGVAIEMIDRKTGALTKRLMDPFFQRSGYDYYGAPILGSMDNVLAYSGLRGKTSSSVLVSWSKKTGDYVWKSADSYATTPAMGNGRVYLSRSTPGELNVLDESNGALLWRWTPPSGEQIVGNTIVTANLVFVSTKTMVYALPIAGTNHDPVWSAPGGGEMAITGEGMLIINRRLDTPNNTNSNESPNALIAYRLS